MTCVRAMADYQAQVTDLEVRTMIDRSVLRFYSRDDEAGLRHTAPQQEKLAS